MSASLLEVSGLSAAYGDREPVLRDVDLTVGAGESVGVVGMNGAGKSTLLKCISGALAPTTGGVRLDGEGVGKTSVADRARAGIVHLPEGHRVLGPLTVRQNLEIACMTLSERRVRRRLAEMLPVVHELFPVLEERAAQPAGLLSGGEQQMLSMARAIIQRPKILLLDEPSLGLAPVIIDRIYKSLTALLERGMGLLIVEQNSQRVSKTCSHLIVLRDGHVVDRGAPDDFDAGRMHRAYFGAPRTANESAETDMQDPMTVAQTPGLNEGENL